MNGHKVLVVIILIAIMVLSWVNYFVFGINKGNSQYNETISEAKDDYQRGLYQLCAEKYEETLKYKDTKDTRDKILISYADLYKQDEKAYSDYLSAAKSAVASYPTDTSYLDKVADLYIEKGKYTEAYTYLKNAIDADMKDGSIYKKYLEVKYSNKLTSQEYPDFIRCSDSRFLVSDESVWKIIDEKGFAVTNSAFSYLSPPNSDGMMMYVDEAGARLIDKDGVVQGIFSKSLESAGLCSENLIAICENGNYSYYSIRGDKLFGAYEEAGTFTNGLAAVKAGGKWGIIDSKGNYVINPKYEDVKLDDQGEYICNSVIIAKENSQYQLYDSKWNAVKGFSCDNMDIPTKDGIIAFMSDGKWGFVDTKGKVVIEPQYDKAKSFSNGLAAVCKDGLWGFIDREGNIALAYQYLDADYFSLKGGCMVRTSPECWKLLMRNITDN